MSKSIAHWNYKTGVRAGYSEYRYGDGTPHRPVYDPRKQPKPIFSKGKREHLSTIAKEALASWSQSPFQFEGTVRAGLRSTLCLAGNPWNASDAEASRIVEKALRSMGATRPTFAQGQKEYTIPRDYCAHCYAALDDEDISNNRRFCSDGCKRMAVADGWERDSLAMRRAWQQASRMARKADADDRTCKCCQRTFKSDRKDASYCSRKCFLDWQSAQIVTKECLWCSKPFTAKLDMAKFCSAACAEGHGRLGRGLFPKNLNVRVFDYLVTVPINASRPVWLTPERFDEMVAA